MEIGVSSLLWHDEEDLAPHLRLLADEGIRRIELRRVPEHLDYEDKDAIRRFGTALREHGVRVSSIHVPDKLIAAMSGLDENARKAAVAETKRIAVALAEIGGGTLVTHAGGKVEDEAQRPRQFAAGQQSVADLAAYCRGLGLPLAVENSLPTAPRIGDTVAEVAELVSGIRAENLGFCLDTSHANIGEDPVAALELVGPRLMALHISDNHGEKDEHALPFDGNIDWPAFMTALRKVAYRGVFTFEVRARLAPREMLGEINARFARLMGLPQEHGK